MERKGAQREQVLHLIEHYGGCTADTVRRVAQETGVPEADVYGVASFYSLIRSPGERIRVCQGLSCMMMGAPRLMAELEAEGVPFEKVSCLAQCDRAPVSIDAQMDLSAAAERGGVTPDNAELPMNLGGADTADYAALATARTMGPEAVIQALVDSGLQGRGGAGFPAHFKWNAVRNEAETTRYVVVNADEGEPGTFKDREVMLRRPHRLLEGLAIAMEVVQATKGYIYIRGEFAEPIRLMKRSLASASAHLGHLDIEVVTGHGAYICGEETALLEALEGRRGMPRLKPPFPTQQGLWGKPTLMNNVETLACVPAIVQRGGAWFKDQGRTEPGTKLYCISGHVQRPGTYELPLGITIDELVDAAGGYVGTPKAFSPGGASSGFLSMAHRDVPLDFRGLPSVGTMLGSAGAVVLNNTVAMPWAAKQQQIFFEDESCGQCAPCRIGCRIQNQALDRYTEGGDTTALDHVGDVHWEMDAGSICGLGMVASVPLKSAIEHFPGEFGRSESS